MNTFWKIVLSATAANGLVGVYADYRQNKVLELLVANAVCQEAMIVLNHQFLMTLVGRSPDQLVDTESACAERNRLSEGYQPDTAELPADGESSQVSE